MLTSELRRKEYVVLTVSDTKSATVGTTPAYDILKYRLKNKIWGLHSRTKCRNYIKDGARLIFYITGKRNHSRCFMAEATAVGSLGSFSSFDLERYTDKKEWIDDGGQVYKIELMGIKWFKNPVNIYDIKDKMELFSRKKTNKWGTFIQGGAFRISDKDYSLIKKKSR